MSAEIKLLNEWVNTYIAQHGLDGVYRETMSLLAQPESTEQTEQEPVAWLITATSCGGAQDWKFVSLERKAPEKLERMFPVFTPLYASPPKREPLSVDEVAQITQGMSEFGADMFKAGIAAAEKAHSIGGDDE